jgi:hypothetical protein
LTQTEAVESQPPTSKKIKNKKISQYQLQLPRAGGREMVDIMRRNAEMLMEREEKLLEMEQRARAPESQATTFEHKAAEVKKTFRTRQ